jgi:hypothetical protein
MGMFRKTLLVGSFVAIVASGGHAAAAVAPVIPTGVTVSPVIQQLHLQPSQSTASFTVQLTNNTKNAVTIALSTVDFVANGQTGGLTFLDKPSSDPNILSHEIASKLSPDINNVSLEPKAAQKIVITLNDVNSLAAGGHYGAVLYRVVDQPSTIKNGNRVSIQQALSTLVFATTDGRGTQGITLLKPSLSTVTFHFPQSINILFQSTGNTQITPRGTVSIIKSGSKVKLSTIVNVNSGMILPGSTRLYNTAIPTNNISWWPARYHVQVAYRYDGQAGFKTYNTSFYYINLWHILLTILIIAVIFWVLIKLKPYYRYLYRLVRYFVRFWIKIIRAMRTRRRNKKQATLAAESEADTLVMLEQQKETEDSSSEDVESSTVQLPIEQPENELAVEAQVPDELVSIETSTAIASTKSTNTTAKTATKTNKSQAKPKKVAKPKKTAAKKPKSVAKKATTQAKKTAPKKKSAAKPKNSAKKT